MRIIITDMKNILLLMLFTLCLPSSFSLADGKLGAFEKSARTSSAKPTRQTIRDDEDKASFFGEIAGELLAYSLLYGGANSLERMDSLSPAARERGEALIPLARLDVGWQHVESDVEAIELMGELGWGPIGLRVGHSLYSEEEPDADLTVTTVTGNYRMSFGSNLEMDLGVGTLTLRGDEENTRSIFTTPVLWYPGRHFGFEYHPVWSTGIRRHDLSVLFRMDYVSLKLGYRWMVAPDESLNGPVVGASIRF